MPDFGRYIGIPFKDHGRDESGCDCWGLVRLIYKNEFGVELSDLGPLYKCTTDKNGIIGLYVSELPKWERVETPQVGDAILLNIRGVPTHVGVVVSENQMIHAERNVETVVERFDSALWGHRVEGFYRLRSSNFMKSGIGS